VKADSSSPALSGQKERDVNGSRTSKQDRRKKKIRYPRSGAREGEGGGEGGVLRVAAKARARGAGRWRKNSCIEKLTILKRKKKEKGNSDKGGGGGGLEQAAGITNQKKKKENKPFEGPPIRENLGEKRRVIGEEGDVALVNNVAQGPDDAGRLSAFGGREGENGGPGAGTGEDFDLGGASARGRSTETPN